MRGAKPKLIATFMLGRSPAVMTPPPARPPNLARLVVCRWGTCFGRGRSGQRDFRGLLERARYERPLIFASKRPKKVQRQKISLRDQSEPCVSHQFRFRFDASFRQQSQRAASHGVTREVCWGILASLRCGTSFGREQRLQSKKVHTRRSVVDDGLPRQEALWASLVTRVTVSPPRCTALRTRRRCAAPATASEGLSAALPL